MKHFDVVVFWTWKSAELRDLEKNMALLESVKPKTCRIALGIYLWDYPGRDPAKAEDKTYVMGHPVPLDLMEHQCSLGLKWLKEGRVSDLVILGLAGIDQGIPSAPWMRDWIKKHGDEKLNRINTKVMAMKCTLLLLIHPSARIIRSTPDWSRTSASTAT